MKDKTNNNNLPEKPDKVSLKTPSDFPSSLNLQLKEFHASPTFFRNLKQTGKATATGLEPTTT